MARFVEALAIMLREKAAEVRDPRSYATLAMAAHLFAAASYLRIAHAVPAMDRGPPPRVCRTADDAVKRIRELAVAPPETLYWELMAALVAIDHEFGDPVRDRRAMPPATRLTALDDDGSPALGGVVFHWVRPHSELVLLRRLRRTRAEERLPVDYPLLPNEHLRGLAMHWQRPGTLPVRSANSKRRLPSRLVTTASLRDESFRIALCPLGLRDHPVFKVDADRPRFTADPATGMPDTLPAHMDLLLDEAEREGVQLLVLPELCVDEPTRQHLVERLRSRPAHPLLGIVAGSFHMWEQPNRRPFNQAVILDSAGRVVLQHHKRGYFRASRAMVLGSPGLFQAESPVAAEVVEDIQRGRVLEVLDTRLGRLAVLICADALEPDPQGLRTAVLTARPDLLFVVAMSPRTQAYEDFAEDMARARIGTLFVNARCAAALHGDDGEVLASMHLPLVETEGAPYVRVRWRYGEDFSQRWSFVGEQKSWLPTGDRAEVPPPLLLPDSLGLVVDLAAHWRHGR